MAGERDDLRRPSFRRRPRVFWTLALIGLGASVWAAAPPPVRGKGLVAADHALASAAGAEALRRGGNAVDAAVAAALAAGVVQPAGSGLGGGGFAVVAGGKASPWILDFREVAPASAAREMFLRDDGKPDSTVSRKGGRAVAVPSESIGLGALWKARGRLSAGEVAAPAVRLAAEGFEVGPHLADALVHTDSDGVRLAFSPFGVLAREGERVKRPALARTLRRWATSGGRDLAEGKGADAILAAVARSGGAMNARDLAAYAPKERQPLIASYRGFTVVTMPPPSSGGIALTQVLSALEMADLKGLGHNSSEHLHRLTEAMKHAYADRAQHLGDPDFVDVPVQRLLSPERIEAIRADFDPTRTFPADHYGSRTEPPKDAGTQHISTLDADGLGVALTTTINTSFGSGVYVEELGIILNNEMDDFAIAPGVPNAFGLVGSEANAIQAGKRPLSSMTPTILLDANGRVAMVVGASGGPQIISSVAQVISSMVDFGLNVQEAVAAPRIHHQWQPDVLMVEPGIPQDVIRALEAKGHKVQVARAYSASQVIVAGPDGREGASDPRKGGWPAAVR